MVGLRRRCWGQAAACGLAVITVAGGLSSAAGAAPDPPAEGELVDVGDGRRVFIECYGADSPTVILVSGYGDKASTWTRAGVLQAVGGFTRVCAYDRPGTIGTGAQDVSRSDPVPMPRSAEDVVAELHATLAAAGEHGPYVFVAHSFGGIFARLYASKYPDEIVGMVLIDSSSEYFIEEFAPSVPPQYDDLLYSIERPAPEALAAYPDFERIFLDASSQQLQVAEKVSPLRAMPLEALSRGVPFGQDDPSIPPDFPSARYEAVWQQLQERLAQLVPGARRVIATESGHYIYRQQPELVIDAVRSVVDAVRRGDTELAATGVATVVLISVATMLTVLGIGLCIAGRRRRWSAVAPPRR